MKLRLLFFLSSFFSFIFPMRPHHHAADFLMFDKSRMPFVIDPTKVETLDDNVRNYKVDTKSLMILIVEVDNIARSRSIPPFFDLIKRIKEGTLQLQHVNKEINTTLVTRKDIEGRLLCFIRTIGSHGIDFESNDPHYRGYGGEIQMPIVIANHIVHLHHHNGTDLQSKTQLWDFSSYKEVSSRNYEDCKKRVEEIVQKYHPNPR